jgi:hypothetical protein
MKAAVVTRSALIGACTLAVLACYPVERKRDESSQAALEQSAERPLLQVTRRPAPGIADPDPLQLEQLRSLGYSLDGGSGAYVQSESQYAGTARRGAKDPDTHSLSELDKRTRQNRSQRSNEALDYLFPANAPVPSRVDQTVASSADREESAPEPRDLVAARRDDAYRLRAAFRRHVVAKKPGDGNSSDGLRSLGYIGGGGGPAPKPPGYLSPAQRFTHQRHVIEGLHFQPGSGYWANTYVPGDPVLRWLESRLEKSDRDALQGFVSRPLVLDAAARQTQQPFDAPAEAALSVFMQADRRGLEAESRMLVQVGLQGAHRRGGLRPAMNVGIVLDLRGAVDATTLASMRALVDGFLEAKDLGDRFSLTVAGRPGGQLVAAEDFRHGPVSVAMSGLIDGNASSRVPGFDLLEAVRATASELQRNDDPTAPLGTSTVLIATSQPLGTHTEALAEAAHESAILGVPVSSVGIGDGIEVSELERIALAGQGNQRLMRSAADAESLVERELTALARVIARALRLNIRLAPGVKLVEVVGADRLDEAGSEQVREAERNVDRRLSRTLGIERDRGRDEDGIQIVIPAFYSGDAHAVLLDVVAAGPGPIAEVTVRYKDLVYLRNSVARAHLALGRGGDAPGPLERNVVKNFLAVQLADALKQAGRSLLEGDDDATLAAVRDFEALIESLRREVPGFANDTDLASDAQLLSEFAALLATNAIDAEQPRQHLADSLQLSGYFKTVPRSRDEIQTARR